ncbi:MAG: GerAB/ArcD/ProY family transporter [Clostridia bacterium]|nr:GerAB/ArcD/ProY family transporter [Clostridia bacterium]
MLTKREFSGLIITAIIVKMFLAYPRRLVMISGQAAWINVIYVSIVAIILTILTNKIYCHKKNVIELAQICGGKRLRIAVGILVFLILLSSYVSISRIFPESVKIILLPHSSARTISVIFAITAGAGAWFGIKSISRINYMFLLIVTVLFMLFLLILIPYYKTDNIFPIFGNGLSSIFISGFNSLSLFSDVIVLNVLIAHGQTLGEVKALNIRAIILSGIAAVMLILAYNLCYTYPISKDFLLPAYKLARMVKVSNFFSRAEAFFEFIWSIIIFIYASIYVYAMALVIEETFMLKFLKPLIIPIVFVGYIISRLPDNLWSTVFYDRVLELIKYPLVFLLPIVFGLLTYRMGEGKNADS